MYTNNTNIDLPLAVWLASSGGYDLTYDPNVLSATTLLNPLKSLILTHRAHEKGLVGSNDLDDQVASRVGSAVHDAAEQVWTNPVAFWEAMEALGYSTETIEHFKINPEVIHEGDIPVFIERRREKAVKGMIVSGKFDFVVDGTLLDIKTTKTYSWKTGSNNEKYQMQGSIYRWLNPEIITAPLMKIQYAFTDWLPQYAKDEKYPNHRVMSKEFPLLPIGHVEQFINNKIQSYKDLLDEDQENLPICTPKELWQDPSEWAYFKNPAAKRATRVYNLQSDAAIHFSKDGNVGRIEERKKPVKFCKYCKARPLCLQAEGYAIEGLLVL